MNDVQGGNLVFKAVLDDTDINRGFERAKREIQKMSGALTNGTDSIQDYFDSIADSLLEQKTFVTQLEKEYANLNSGKNEENK